MNQPAYKKKLIEVAIPLEAINREAAREKSIRHGHPSTLHLWWARRPLAACRAVLFASIVDDPSSHPDKFPSEAAQEMERKRLFRIIEELVKWENSNNEKVLKMARDEIMKSTNGNPPPVLDPFCGGGSIPLEAQRLGLEAHGSDLNPVAVLITKALIEIPPKFAGKQPVNPDYRKAKKKDPVSGAQGLAADMAYYGAWMRQEAEKRIGKYYPKIKLPKDAGGEEASVIAWIWARTVKCPNPACGCEMPLVRSFALSTKAGKEAWIEPIIHSGKPPRIEFTVKTGKGKPPAPPKIGRGAKFKCIACQQATDDSYIKESGLKGKMNSVLMAIVAEGKKGRIYLSPEKAHIETAAKPQPEWAPDEDLAYEPRAIWCTGYGLKKFRHLFTNRQLVALTTFSDLVGEVREQVKKHAIESGLKDDGISLENGGTGATAYADAVSVYLAFGVGKASNLWSSITSWMSDRGAFRETFARQAIPMVWDFAEANPFSDSGGNFALFVERAADSLSYLPHSHHNGVVLQEDASTRKFSPCIISTDPPYYDNIGYADLSDYFYVWLRRSLNHLRSSIFSTILVPKKEELIASPYRFDGNKQAAKSFFESGFMSVFSNAIVALKNDFPITIYYAFKQSESDSSDDEESTSSEDQSSTGWETMLSGIITSGYSIVGTWPLRTEGSGRLLAKGTNALASSIVIVCRPRQKDAVTATLSDFKKILRRELKPAIKELLRCNLAPVDLPQSAIGPGIGVFSRYKSVIDANGEPVSVKSALVEINRVLSEYLDESGNTFDSDTLWAIEWFKINGFDAGKYGDAELLARAKNTSIDGLASGGIASAKGGKVQLLARNELPSDWDPKTDNRISVWETTQHLVRVLEKEGESATAKLLADLGSSGEDAKALAYRLFAIAESKGWSEEARAYNALIMSWSEIESLTAA